MVAGTKKYGCLNDFKKRLANHFHKKTDSETEQTEERGGWSGRPGGGVLGNQTWVVQKGVEKTPSQHEPEGQT